MTTPTGNVFAGLTADDFQPQIVDELPQGPAWPRDPDTVLSRYFGGVADAFARLHARAGVLSEQESDPTQAVELLADWERVYGLPDPCSPLNPTLQQRHGALAARIAAVGGQSIAYYQQVAAALGYQITITEFRPFRVGQGRVGQPLYGEGWAYVWRVNAAATTVQPFRVGASAVGEPLRVWGNAQLECVLKRLAPAHTIVLFGYT